MDTALIEFIYTDIARNTGVFRPAELDVLTELAREAAMPGKTNYRMIRDEVDGKIAGFIIFGRTPGTDFSWDIYWLVVDIADHRKGVGKKLLYMAEKEILTTSARAVIRVETSSRKEYLPARTFYSNNGFSVIGKIADFYGEGDALVIYAKRSGCLAGARENKRTLFD